MKYLFYFKESLTIIKYKRNHIEPGEEIYRYGTWQINAYDGKKNIGYINYEICNLIYGGAWDGITTHIKDDEIEKILNDKYKDPDCVDEIYFCDLQLVFVNEEYRKQNIGEIMLNMAIEHVKKLQIGYIFGFSMPYFDKEREPDNRKSIEFSDFDIEKLVKWYEKLGFKRVKKYHDGWLIIKYLGC